MLDGLNDYKNWTKMLPILPDNKLPNNDRVSYKRVPCSLGLFAFKLAELEKLLACF